MFYALMAPDNAATVAGGIAVQFPRAGATYGPTPPIPAPAPPVGSGAAGAFIVPAAGTYLVSYQVSVTEPGQLQLWRGLGGVTVSVESTATRATGTSEITNTVLLTLVANEILSLRNPTGAGTALTITPAAGAGQPSATGATLTITRVG
jgi:hypothetical protein